MTGARTPAPLAGVRVLDFSQLLPGGHAGMVLADFGAQVVKVEPPAGDPMRRVDPQVSAGGSARHAVLNRGKRSIVADLKDPEQHAMVKALAADCDVLMESFRPGVMDRLGLGYDELVQDNPRLVYLSLTGYGGSGARSSLPSHDLNFMALSGLLGPGQHGSVGVPPIQVGDLAGGSLQGVIGVLLALRVAEATGRGQRVEVAMLDGLVSLLASAVADAGADLSFVPGRGRLGGDFACYATYDCVDGRVAVGALEAKFWKEFLTRLGLSDLLTMDHLDPAPEVQSRLREHLARRIGQSTLEEVAALGEDLCVSPIREFADLMRDGALHSRGVLRAGREGGGLVEPGVLPRLHEYVPELPAAGEPLGASTEMIRQFGWLA